MKKKDIKQVPDSPSTSDDSEDESTLLRTGRVPTKWYSDFKHVGYDINASKVLKSKQSSMIDDLINKSENPAWWRTVRDELNNSDIVLTDEQLDLLSRIRGSKFADKSISANDYSVEFDWNEGMFPLSSAPIPKRKFLPSKYERIKVNKLVQAIKLGRIDLNPKQKPIEKLFDIWENSEPQDILKRMPPKIAAPKMILPGHEESYNPSEEYLLTEEEKKQWEATDPEDRELNFIPKKYDCLRKVAGYENFVKERFERCLDLYLCPRVKRKKLNIDEDQLIPKLPKPSELRPFPTMANIYYKGHEARVRGLAIHHSGLFFASGDEMGFVIVWEVLTGRIMRKLKFNEIIYSLDWSQDNKGGLLVICTGTNVLIYNFDFLPKLDYKNNEFLIEDSLAANKNVTNPVIKWEYVAKDHEDYETGKRIYFELVSQVKFVTFHEKGDYFATVCPETKNQNDVVLIHSLSKGSSQRPFNKSKADISKVLFHPLKPFLFILTKKNTYIYNLQKQSLVKKLVSGAQWNSCLAVHIKGDNLITGSYDKKICWFDLDLGNTPYKTLKYHEKAIRQVNFHRTYPLFATSSDDGCINIFHATVYNDLMQNALIVPLKILKGHQIKDDLGVIDIKFHPKQPWIFSAGADHNVILWS